MIDLRPHQTRTVEMLRSSLAGGHLRPMVKLPTGAGKTRLAAALIKMTLAKGRRAIFCVPAISLVDQTVRAFWDVGIQDVGVIQANHPLTDWSKPVQVASVQTMQRRSELPEAGLVIVDEAHVRNDHLWSLMASDAWRRIPVIGLSATPWAKGLGKVYDDLIIGATTQELIDAGYLSPFKVFAPSHPDLGGVKITAGDYQQDQLGETMAKPQLVADVVSTWCEKGEGRPTLCFAVNRAHAKALQDQFEAVGVPTGYVDAHSTMDERAQVERLFRAGAIKVVCNVGVLTTGVDWDVRCLILARPTKSEMLYVQTIGRALRPAPGKDHALILDHSDTTLRLGFVTDIDHDALDDGKPKAKSEGGRDKAPPLPKECPACAFLKPARMFICPACGHKPEARSDIEAVDGELVELGAKRAKVAKGEVDAATKQRWYSGLLGICDERGYQRGWAANKYREKFGVWPRGLADCPVEPGPEIRAYVRHLQIKWAKSQQRRAANA